jgi:alpha-tubulin suppressor-like RCC1 family protein
MGRKSLLSVVCAFFVLFLVSEAQGATIAAGANHTLAIKADGTLWAWGDNTFGELGLGPGSPASAASPQPTDQSLTWTAVAAGTNFSVGIQSDGTLWAWGSGASGQLGNGGIANSLSPVQEFTASTWTAVAAGSNFTVAIRSDGTLWAWGNNTSGQLGIGSTGGSFSSPQGPIGTATNWTAVAAGKDFAFALRSDGSLWAWGDNASGQLGDGTTTSQIVPEQIVPSFTWSAVAAGSNFTMGLRADKTLWAWGANNSGQLGFGTTTGSPSPAQVLVLGWVAVAAGTDFTITLRADGTLWAWGDNSAGELGDSTTVTQTSPEQIISTGFPVSLAVMSVVPAMGARNVSINSSIQATFSEAVDPTTLSTTSFFLNGSVTGTVTFDSSTNTATFTPSGHLSSDTPYIATITTGVTDTSGNGLAGNFTWTFTTGKKKSGCFIATAAYGSYLDPRVNALRLFRDRYLLTNRAGRYFVDQYYRFSPPIAEVIARHGALRSVTRWALTPLVAGVMHPLLFGLTLLGLAGLSPIALRSCRKEKRGR